ncbi:MAG: FecR family protein [Pseudomonadota bacterium]
MAMITLKSSMKRWVGLVACWIITVGVMVPTSPAAETPGIIVGRVSHIEGYLLRYIPEERDWVALVADAPFGTEDTLFSGSSGMAELIIPNGTWIRTGNNTQIQFIALETDLVKMDIASGMARFSNKGPQTVIQVTSPFGYVLADRGTVFDLYVGENSIEVVTIKGTVSFVHSSTDAKYVVVTGSSSLL